jgi:hypothetical protein
MSRKEDEAYAEWLDEIKSNHPEVADSLEALAETDAGRELFRGGLREKDYYRRLNEIRDARTELDEETQKQVSWWQEAKPEYERALAERDEALQKLEAASMNRGGGGNGNGTPPSNPQNQKELEDLRNRLMAMDQAYPQVMLGMFEAQQAALREGLEYKPDEVLKRAFEKKMRPIEAFNEIVATQRHEKAKSMLEGELNKAREEGYKQALSKLSGPDQILKRSGPSIVDALTGDAAVMTDPRQRRDAAVKEYLELTSEQG